MRSIIHNTVIGSLLVSSLISCSTMNESLSLGTGAGALTGAMIGSRSDSSRSRGALQGLMIGSALGALIGLFTHQAMKTRDDQKEKDVLLNLEKYPSKTEGPTIRSRIIEGRAGDRDFGRRW